jgi:alanyl-tRNA synthetase
VVSSVAAGDRFRVVLDRTAFYPTSGGQPFDTGTLGAARVLEVEDDDAGVIHHVLNAPLEPGTRITGRIDWPRRLDHMQQHTGQHILSAAFDRLFQVRTTSFHLGADVATIDLAREVTPAEIAQGADRGESHHLGGTADYRALRVRRRGQQASVAERARQDRSVTHHRGDGFRRVGVRRHARATGGMIGAILVAGWERFKGATRLTFMCGGRALRSHDALRDVVVAATRALSVLPSEVEGAIGRLQSEAREKERELRRIQEAAATLRAGVLRHSAPTLGRVRGVLLTEPGWTRRR